MAVHNGEFTLDTALRMSPDAESFEDAFEELRHASLVAANVSGATTRYRLLDVVRHVALARLRSRDELADRYDRFVDVVLSVVGDRLTGSGLTWGPDVLHDAVAQFDDVAAAIRWNAEHDREPGRALSLCSALLVIIEQDRAGDVLSLTRRVFDRWPEALTSGAAVAAEAVATFANAENLAGSAARGLELAREALTTLTEPGLANVTLRQRWATARWPWATERPPRRSSRCRCHGTRHGSGTLDWGARLGFDPTRLAAVNRRAVAFASSLAAQRPATTAVVNGVIGPRGDGYVVGATMTASEATTYHGLQTRAFADAGAEMISVITMTYSEEAIGIARAAEAVNLPAVISFTVETDGRLPSGLPIGTAIVRERTSDAAPLLRALPRARHRPRGRDRDRNAEWRANSP